MEPGDSEQVHQASSAKRLLDILGECRALAEEQTVGQTSLKWWKDTIEPREELLADGVPVSENETATGANVLYLGFTVNRHRGKDPLSGKIGPVIEVRKALRHLSLSC
jgi:hypothetical protein